MNVTDPIADLLTRIRNAIKAGLKYVNIPASKIKIEITKILEIEGLIHGYRLIKDDRQGKIKIAIKYNITGKSVINGIVRVSKPSCRIYSKVDEFIKVKNGLGFGIISTSKGILTTKSAKTQRVGGEILAYVW